MFTNLQNWIIGVVILTIALPMLVKLGKTFLTRDLKNVLHKSMTLEQVADPQLREKLKRISMALVDLLEYNTPDRGKGAEKFAKADAALASIPLLSANPDIRKALIEDACELMWTADDVMKVEVQEHQPPAPPAAPAA